MQNWHQFLQNSARNTQTAVVENHQVVNFGDAISEHKALAQETVVCDLSHFGLLEVEGEDALNFLQGQVTNDIKLLNGNNAQYTAYCTPKGRMLALFLAFSHYNHVHLQMPKELVGTILKRLKMYVMRSKVDIIDVSDTIVRLGLNGSKATELLSEIFTKIPTQDYELVSLENGAVIKLPGAQPRYQIFTSLENAPSIWAALTRLAKPVGAEAWEWLEIQAGIPTITLKTQEEFVPQMLNLDALDAINYKKGCYTGQEIVARTHYLGKVKRRTQLAHITSDVAPNIGDDIVDANQQAIGKIVRVAAALETGYDVLLECRLENIDAEKNIQPNVFWNAIALVIRPLPYQLAEN